MKRSPEEVEWRADLLLVRFPIDVRQKLIVVARTKSPSAVARVAKQTVMIAGFSDQISQLAAEKGTRWLAVIRRDHGLEKFDQAATDLLKLPYTEQRQ